MGDCSREHHIVYDEEHRIWYCTECAGVFSDQGWIHHAKKSEEKDAQAVNFQKPEAPRGQP